MEEFQIASSMAQVLNILQHSGEVSDDGYSSSTCDYRRRSSVKLGREELQLATLASTTAKLAMSRARATGRDFNSVMAETELAVSIQLARILAGSIDPLLEGLTKVVVKDDEEHICGVCQDEIRGGDEARAMVCRHKFHAYCIVKWLKQKKGAVACSIIVPCDQIWHECAASNTSSSIQAEEIFKSIIHLFSLIIFQLLECTTHFRKLYNPATAFSGHNESPFSASETDLDNPSSSATFSIRIRTSFPSFILAETREYP
ncbi:hypothetical protein F0562_001541 [Nyssa sinensis]|uniref:RING-type domain-containing protein n=1 Tax=Nyssa sinensis TaxID=561372 RepID=A0A5J5C7H3_9ASTE|nr:hypothetical protein F0562_001541 [Nyssa sinensis]